MGHRNRGLAYALLLISLTLSLLACSTFTNILNEDNGAASSAPVGDLLSAGPDCPAPTEDHLLFIFPNIEEMTLLTDRHGGGIRPLLAWEPVEGAASYGASIDDPQGEPYWAWRGEETQIYVGGVTEPPSLTAEGPMVIDCMTWETTAYDEEGVPIAAGGPRLISP